MLQKTVKPFLPDKITSTQKITLDNDEIVTINDDTAKVLSYQI